MRNLFIYQTMIRWLLSTNDKDIGTLYLIYAIFAGLAGTAFSVLIRLELSAPGSQFLAGDHQLYNVILTAHGLVMVFFAVTPFLVVLGSNQNMSIKNIKIRKCLITL